MSTSNLRSEIPSPGYLAEECRVARTSVVTFAEPISELGGPNTGDATCRDALVWCAADVVTPKSDYVQRAVRDMDLVRNVGI